jgi:hypothetical protein
MGQTESREQQLERELQEALYEQELLIKEKATLEAKLLTGLVSGKDIQRLEEINKILDRSKFINQ